MQKINFDTLSSTSRETVMRLLDVSEVLFSESGYAGTTVRDISAKSNINQALINYHFQNKRGLFMAIFARRGKILSDERLRLLDEFRQEANGQSIPLKKLIYAFVYPPLRLAGESTGGRAFVKLQARLHNEPKDIETTLRQEYYDRVSLEFMEEFHKTLPQISRESIAWRMIFIMGLYIYVASNTGRLEVISNRKCKGSNWKEALEEILNFCEHGFLAPVTDTTLVLP
ncbi:TetR/AcrR family transcriptional regulator [Polynucleobacter kasalickyi]|uniref:Transcriptional regulator, TetR family n=1 Tax=Polynucleobacter kasalickyi TaxID=1938817 RepID=A0A1W2AGD3_9BURK|nr:TetR/AcrR family transcriptional regulator [Polynucleobacter kasalickyi]SMC59640.1 transcriptional regulator, TetR family [Polynucleobacter kasalickyi]